MCYCVHSSKNQSTTLLNNFSVSLFYANRLKNSNNNNNKSISYNFAQLCKNV